MKIYGMLFIIIFSISSYAYSPKIIAHRGGSEEFPGNTIAAIHDSLKSGANGVEVDVQLSKDGVVILYHPRDLSVLTGVDGKVSEFTVSELKKLDIAYNFDPKGDKTFPKRAKGYRIATLSELLDLFPNQEFIVDLKSLPEDKLIDAIIVLVDKKKAWNRIVFYSTNDVHLDYLKQHKPEAKLFESRSKTRRRLLTLRNEDICCCKDKNSEYIGFELDREMVVKESFALGNSENKVHFKLWDQKAVDCIKDSDIKYIFLFGINTKQDYEEAKRLNTYAVFTDNPISLIKMITESP